MQRRTQSVGLSLSSTSAEVAVRTVHHCCGKVTALHAKDLFNVHLKLLFLNNTPPFFFSSLTFFYSPHNSSVPWWGRRPTRMQSASRNPLRQDEIELNKTMSEAAIALGERIDHLEEKVSLMRVRFFID